jgi:hypothetical protein
MKKRLGFICLVLLVLFLVSCPAPVGVRNGPAPASSNAPGGASFSIMVDASRGQAVLVTPNGSAVDIAAVTGDGSTVRASDAIGVAVVQDADGSRSLSGGRQAVIVGTRNDGRPGAWHYSGGRMQPVVDEDSGSPTSLLPESGDRDGKLRGAFGWTYHVQGISEDGKLIAGYAENKNGFSWGRFQIDPGTTIGVYWRASRHTNDSFLHVSRAHIIGTLDLTKLQTAPPPVRHWARWAMKHFLDHLKWFFLNYLSSYLVMVDLNGVHFDGSNNVYLVSGTDQNDNPAIASIGQDGSITITPQQSTPGVTISTIAGTGAGGFSGDGGSAASAQLNSPSGIARDGSGNLYIADSGNQRVREVVSGTISTVAGNGTAGYSGDGGGATGAQLNSPSGVAVDSAGNVSIADRINSVVRRVSGATITTVAGTSAQGYSGDGGPGTLALLDRPSGVAVDASGNIYIADTINSAVRKVSGTTITTVAGSGPANFGYAGDNGPATSAKLSWPRGVAVDTSGNLYIADSINNVIRKVSGTTITTVAGNGTAGYAGDGGAATSAQLNGPYGVAVDASGNLYIADTGNNVIRKVTGTTITTIAGTGTGGYAGDGGAPTTATLNQPQGVLVDASGLYIADTGNNVVRIVK